jgi:hypothetical protein
LGNRQNEIATLYFSKFSKNTSKMQRMFGVNVQIEQKPVNLSDVEFLKTWIIFFEQNKIFERSHICPNGFLVSSKDALWPPFLSFEKEILQAIWNWKFLSKKTLSPIAAICEGRGQIPARNKLTLLTCTAKFSHFLFLSHFPLTAFKKKYFLMIKEVTTFCIVLRSHIYMAQFFFLENELAQKSDCLRSFLDQDDVAVTTAWGDFTMFYQRDFFLFYFVFEVMVFWNKSYALHQ